MVGSSYTACAKCSKGSESLGNLRFLFALVVVRTSDDDDEDDVGALNLSAEDLAFRYSSHFVIHASHFGWSKEDRYVVAGSTLGISV